MPTHDLLVKTDDWKVKVVLGITFHPRPEPLGFLALAKLQYADMVGIEQEHKIYGSLCDPCALRHSAPSFNTSLNSGNSFIEPTISSSQLFCAVRDATSSRFNSATSSSRSATRCSMEMRSCMLKPKRRMPSEPVITRFEYPSLSYPPQGSFPRAPVAHILSTTSMPSNSSPCLIVRAVRSHNCNRLSRSSAVSAFSTGHSSKKVENRLARSNK